MAWLVGGQMKSTYLLLDDIASELEKDFIEVMFDKEKGISAAPSVWIGHAPPKRSMPAGIEDQMAAGDPPFVLVRYLDDEFTDTREGGQSITSTVGILCGVYSRDSQKDVKMGYKDVMNMMDRVFLTITKKMYWGDKGKKIWARIGSIKRTTGLEKELASIYEAGLHSHPIYGAAVVVKFKCAAIINPVI